MYTDLGWSTLVVARDMVQVTCAADVQSIVRRANKTGSRISICGARTSMGGQGCRAGTLNISTAALSHTVFDPATKVLRVGAGATWEAVIEATEDASRAPLAVPLILESSVAGAVSTDAIGCDARGLRIADSVASMTVVTHKGDLVHCSRTQHAALFHRVAGGYGLFGIIVELQLYTQTDRFCRYMHVYIRTHNTHLPSLTIETCYRSDTTAGDALPGLVEAIEAAIAKAGARGKGIEGRGAAPGQLATLFAHIDGDPDSEEWELTSAVATKHALDSEAAVDSDNSELEDLERLSECITEHCMGASVFVGGAASGSNSDSDSDSNSTGVPAAAPPVTKDVRKWLEQEGASQPAACRVAHEYTVPLSKALPFLRRLKQTRLAARDILLRVAPHAQARGPPSGQRPLGCTLMRRTAHGADAAPCCVSLLFVTDVELTRSGAQEREFDMRDAARTALALGGDVSLAYELMLSHDEVG